MAKRDHVAEVLEVKSREGRRRLPSEYQLGDLRHLWVSQRDQLKNVSDFFPMRIVTIVEVFVRRWIERLIDFGHPYLETGAELLRDAKFDYATTIAIQGKRVSLGELVAHAISLNDIGQIGACFTRILGGDDFFGAIEHTYDRFKVERNGAPKAPIIPDLAETKAILARLFDVRHIVTHELPGTPPYAKEEIDGFLKAAIEFVDATDEMLNNRLYPNAPLTTRESVEEAAREYFSLIETIDTMLPTVAAFVCSPFDETLVSRCQDAWKIYADLQAKLRAAHLEGGTYQPWIELREASRLAKARIEDLRWWAERQEGDI